MKLLVILALLLTACSSAFAYGHGISDENDPSSYGHGIANENNSGSYDHESSNYDSDSMAQSQGHRFIA